MSSREGNTILLTKIPASTMIYFLNDDFKRSMMYQCLSSLLESRLALGIKHFWGAIPVISFKLWDENAIGRAKMEYYFSGTERLWKGNWNHRVYHKWKCEVYRPYRFTVVNPCKETEVLLSVESLLSSSTEYIWPISFSKSKLLIDYTSSIYLYVKLIRDANRFFPAESRYYEFCLVIV